jgi:hypothetical protein
VPVAREYAPVYLVFLELLRVELPEAASERRDEAETERDESEHAEHADKREQSQLPNPPLWPSRPLLT